MAQDFANIVGGFSAEQIMKMKADEQLLLIEGKHVKCKQAVITTMSCSSNMFRLNNCLLRDVRGRQPFSHSAVN